MIILVQDSTVTKTSAERQREYRERKKVINIRKRKESDKRNFSKKL